MLAKIIASQSAEPGTAQLMVRLRGEQGVLSNLTFALCNNEQNYLQPNGGWSPAQHWFTIGDGYSLNGGSGFHIGPTILDPLLANASQAQIQAKLASGETRSTTLQLARDELLSSGARGQTDDYSGGSILTTPEPEPAQEPIIEPVTQPEPEPLAPIVAVDEPKQKRQSSLVPIIAGVLAALFIAGGALWWFFGKSEATDAPTAPTQEATASSISPSTPAAPASQPAATDCSAANLSSQSELDFVQACVQQKLDSDKLLAVIQAAKAANKCGVAQRLYANRAQGGDNTIALAYAREYDPKYHQPSECFKEADKDTAAYWYETILQTDPANQEAKARSEELSK